MSPVEYLYKLLTLITNNGEILSAFSFNNGLEKAPI
jgi:hypothetical protein